MSLWLVLIGSAVVLALFIVVLTVGVRGVAGRATQSAADDPATVGATMMVGVLMPGGQAASGTRLGGNGVLAILSHDVCFVLAVPRRVLTIPRREITSMAVTKSLRGPGRYRRGPMSFLVIEWTAADGPHTVGFQTNRGNDLIAALETSPTPD